MLAGGLNLNLGVVLSARRSNDLQIHASGAQVSTPPTRQTSSYSPDAYVLELGQRPDCRACMQIPGEEPTCRANPAAPSASARRLSAGWTRGRRRRDALQASALQFGRIRRPEPRVLSLSLDVQLGGGGTCDDLSIDASPVQLKPRPIRTTSLQGQVSGVQTTWTAAASNASARPRRAGRSGHRVADGLARGELQRCEVGGVGRRPGARGVRPLVRRRTRAGAGRSYAVVFATSRARSRRSHAAADGQVLGRTSGGRRRCEGAAKSGGTVTRIQKGTGRARRGRARSRARAAPASYARGRFLRQHKGRRAPRRSGATREARGRACGRGGM
ncbi:hypothetical protein OH77DRAFT_1300412 [Trametes cingulata]|nr:hypothetical protein OH77DRAFT_1300412 [Trametes cingulata]